MKTFRSAVLLLFCISCVLQDAGRTEGEQDRNLLVGFLFFNPGRFFYPRSLAFDSKGNLHVSDGTHERIRKITPEDRVLTAMDWLFSAGPQGIVFDGEDNLYVADSTGIIRKIAPDGSEITLAGSKLNSGFQDGQGNAARFDYPFGISMDLSENLYVADYFNHAIRRVAPDGSVETIAGNGEAGYAEGIGGAAQFDGPLDVAVGPDGMIYVAGGGGRLRRIDPLTRETSTHAGTGEIGYADGFRTEAMVSPRNLTFDPRGNLYFSDAISGNVRRISPDGMVSTFAGNGEEGYRDGPGEQAMFFFPTGLTTDSAGNVYVADSYNFVIRKISPDGVVSTIAGVPGQFGGNDGPTGW